jgi:small subunit ribosomal protein S18
MAKKVNTDTKETRKEKFSWRDYEELSSFINDRGRIVGRDRTGLSAKDQKRMAIGVKRARFLGLLPFSVKV